VVVVVVARRCCRLVVARRLWFVVRFGTLCRYTVLLVVID
jgi:hypothetical protein